MLEKSFSWFRAVVLALIFVSTQTNALQTQKIRIITDDDYPPYSYVEKGRLKGLYIDLMKRVSHELGPTLDIKLIPVPWKRALKEIELGTEFAILPPYRHVESRPFISHYSKSIGIEEIVVFCHNSIDLNDYFNIANEVSTPLRLGINSGYLILNFKYQIAVKNGRIMLEENKSTLHNIEKLLMGRIDCYINDRKSITKAFEMSEIANPNTDTSQFSVTEIISSHSAHVGFSRAYLTNNPSKIELINKINDAITKVMTDSE